ncbi:hypothetical protein C3K47_00485 [Solitalea longa]|uniref:RDD domain-containing protein n=1 Tax=Solitalea longa TaxID=2079460 RepID=A0A2S5A9G1_9SPHI|nr:RDD family protein [Solitalea longa]POY39012.1 hypothetical protein C3K47_00485 [Solitalea longa]
MELKIKSNFRKRISAAILDYLIFSIVFYYYLAVLGKQTDGKFTFYEWDIVFPVVVFWIFYFVIIEGIWGGTLGFQSMGLKVITDTRNTIGMTQAFLRRLLDPIDIFCCGIPGILALKFTEKHQRFGDLIAKTIVVDIFDQEQYVTPEDQY